MKIRVDMEAKPWNAPNYVVCEIGGKETSIPLAEAPKDLVRELVKAWMKDVYQKAGIEPD